MRLNLGCGFTTPNGWVNVDYAFGARFSKFLLFRLINRLFRVFPNAWSKSIIIHNLNSPFPWDDRSADAIYASHVLEHFTRDDGAAFLRECSRVLKDDGIIRVVVPDFQVLVDQYTRGDLSADMFLNASGVVDVRLGFMGIKYFKNFFSSHKCMYDEASLLSAMRCSGIVAIRRSALDSSIANINEVELLERTEHAVIIEGMRLL